MRNRVRGLPFGRAPHLLAVFAVLATLLSPTPARAAMGTITATQSVNIRACAALDCQVIGAATGA